MVDLTMLRSRIALIVLATLFITACSSNEKDKNNQGQPHIGNLEVIAVQTHITPEKGQPGAPIKIEALVTQGTEKVLDANEVLFEIWRKGQEGEHEKILGSHKGEGIYAIEKAFTEEGLYYVISHVTARQMHTMPTNAFVIGKVSDEDLHEMEEVNSGGMDDDHDHEHGAETDHGKNAGH